MKRLLTLAISLLALPAWAQSPAELELMKAITQGGRWGNPRYTTTTRPPCNTSNLGAKIENTTTGTEQRCTGSAWVSTNVPSSIATGTAVTGGGANRLLYEDASQNLAASANGSFDGTILSIGGVPTAANAVSIQETAGCITWEGTASDANQGRLCWPSTTGDLNLDLPTAGTGSGVLLGHVGGIVIPNTALTFQGAVVTSGLLTANAGITVATATGMTVNSNLRIGFNAGFTEGTLRYTTSQTPDAFAIGSGPTAERIILAQTADLNTGTDMQNCDAGTGAAVDPGLCVKPATATTTDYCVLTVHGLSCKYVKTLTESAATSVWRIPTAAEAVTSGEFFYTIYATDGSTPQNRFGRVLFNVTDDGTDTTCVLGTPEELDNTPTGTLTVTVTCDDTAASFVDLDLNAVSSLSQTTLEVYTSLILVGPGLVARQ